MKKYLLAILSILIFYTANATHNRAGEITYEQLSQYTYKITIVTYTATGPGTRADRKELEVAWGDNTFSTLSRDTYTDLPDYYRRNIYTGTHTYSGPGSYQIYMEDRNRNSGVDNIPGSVEVSFTLKTTLQINPFLGYNNTPWLLAPPIDKAAKGQMFIHNPAAWDPDGDSLSYKLTPCLGENGRPIKNYSYPLALDTLYVDAYTGDLVWSAPTKVGIFNIAMLIEEWRNGILIGSILRDMQIEVFETDNVPPKFDPLDQVCVQVGDTVKLQVTARDSINEILTLEAIGGPLLLENDYAFFYKTENGNRKIIDTTVVNGTFEWVTKCNLVRQKAYNVVFKAYDNHTILNPNTKLWSPLNLVNYTNTNISIIGAAPKNIRLIPTINTVEVNWEPTNCEQVIRYDIYRKTSPYGFVPNICEKGVPSYTGFDKIAEVLATQNTEYLDNNNSHNLLQGYNYCYHVVAIFPDGAESYASAEACTELIRGIPFINKVSVAETHLTEGIIEVGWEKPTEIDLVKYPGPYEYVIYRTKNIYGVGMEKVDIVHGIKSQHFTDKLLNTEEEIYVYMVEFYNSPDQVLIGTPHVASSHFLMGKAADNSVTLSFDKNVPWRDTAFVVYRQNPTSTNFDSIAYTYENSYTDKNLVNGQTYLYKTKVIGKYPYAEITNKPFANLSQTISATPIDTLPPCIPELEVRSFCEQMYNQLNWNNVNLSCESDALGYRLWYTDTYNNELALLFDTEGPEIIDFTHRPETSLAACYAISAYDSIGNESEKSARVCIDNCNFYKFPNVFTPDGNQINDIFVPLEIQYIESVDFRIYNRWGALVFKTNEPNVNWDGKHFENSKPVPEGYYYYVANTKEHRLSGIENGYVVGFVLLMRDKDSMTD